METHVGSRVTPGQQQFSPIATVYVNTVMFATLRREKMGLRNSREALTLAGIIDALLRGNPAGALDI
eukprot:5308374-Karenia_brevis.AAC.1